MKNCEIKVSTFTLPEVPEESLKLHFRLGVIGASGQGKTTAIVNYIKKFYKNKKVFNNIILISPTGCINKETGMRGEAKWNDIADEEYDNFSKSVLKEILDKQTERIVKHKEYLHDKELYDKFIKKGVDAIDYLDLIKLYDKYNMERPEPPYGTEYYPTALLIFDDCASATQDKALADYFSKSRHYNTSAIVLSQHYAQLSKALRNNLSALILFKTMDEPLLKLLHSQSCAGDMTQDKFLNMFKGLENRFNFIFMNFNECDDKKRYKQDFDKPLLVA